MSENSQDRLLEIVERYFGVVLETVHRPHGNLSHPVPTETDLQTAGTPDEH